MTVSNPLKWHGGKSYLADQIIALMPPHTHYVEPFFGGGAVLFRKPCDGVSEVVNDLNGALVNFWQVIANEDTCELLKRWAEGTPVCESAFEAACRESNHWKGWYKGDGVSVSLAHAFFVKYRQSRQGLGKDFATLSRNRTRRGMNEQVSSWLTAIEGLPEAHERLKRVVILNAEACDVIRQQDGPNTLFYCDPPYLHSTRVTTGDYECEMSEANHAQLLLTLDGIEGKFVLSGYHSKLYDNHAATRGWRCVEIKIDNKASSKAVKEQKTECLWMNY